MTGLLPKQSDTASVKEMSGIAGYNDAPQKWKNSYLHYLLLF